MMSNSVKFVLKETEFFKFTYLVLGNLKIFYNTLFFKGVRYSATNSLDIPC